MEALNKAIKQVGSQSAMAKAIGVAPQSVYNWLTRGNVPAEHCPDIERVTNGSVKCEDLRPDVDWAYLRGTSQINGDCSTAVDFAITDPRQGIERRRPDLRQCNDRRKESV